MVRDGGCDGFGGCRLGWASAWQVKDYAIGSQHQHRTHLRVQLTPGPWARAQQTLFSSGSMVVYRISREIETAVRRLPLALLGSGASPGSTGGNSATHNAVRSLRKRTASTRFIARQICRSRSVLRWQMVENVGTVLVVEDEALDRDLMSPRRFRTEYAQIAGA